MEKKILLKNDEDSILLHNAEILDSMQESKGNYRKIIRALIAKGVQNLKDGAVVIDSVADLERLIKLDLELQKDDLII